MYGIKRKLRELMLNRHFLHCFWVVLLFVYALSMSAQTVSYTYRPFRAEGCEMTYKIMKQDSACYIIATVRSDRMNFLSKPTMKIRTFNDDVITLNGVLLGSSSTSTGILAGNIVIPVAEISSSAQFLITSDELELLNQGVSKIRLSMIPMDHERTFTKDILGKKLYQFYLKIQTKDEGF